MRQFQKSLKPFLFRLAEELGAFPTIGSANGDTDSNDQDVLQLVQFVVPTGILHLREALCHPGLSFLLLHGTPPTLDRAL